MTRLASIDIGTNTIRLLIAEVYGPGNFKRILLRKDMTRLGEAFVNKGEISFKAIQRSVRVLGEYANLAKRFDADKILPVATSVVREAANKDEFLKNIAENTGLEVRVISEKEEATLALAGVLSVVDGLIDSSLVIDIGGGSTEFAIIENRVPASVHSLDLGAVYLTEKFIRSDPPTRVELQKLEAFVHKRLLSMLGSNFEKKTGVAFSSFVGTAGTITTLAAIDQGMSAYDPEKINRYVLTKESVQCIYNRLREIPLSERCSISGLERGREDIILAGTVVLLKIMEVLNFQQVVVSDHGLLEGIILSCFPTIAES